MNASVNIVSVSDLVGALHEFILKDAAERDARATYEGYEWGYHGYSFMRDRDKAAANFGEKLNAYIDQRIQAAAGAAP